MPSVSEPKKRVRRRPDGSELVRGAFSYYDRAGRRHFVVTKTKSEANDRRGEILEQLRHGTHTPDSKSLTVYEVGKGWITFKRLLKRRRATLTNYEQHLELHITTPRSE